MHISRVRIWRERLCPIIIRRTLGRHNNFYYHECVNDQDTSFASRVVHTCIASFAEVNGYLATDAAGGTDDKCDFGGWLGHDGNLMSSEVGN